jgi:hypothetical protein
VDIADESTLENRFDTFPLLSGVVAWEREPRRVPEADSFAVALVRFFEGRSRRVFDEALILMLLHHC